MKQVTREERWELPEKIGRLEKNIKVWDGIK
jgi:hypothetical protein